MKETRNEWLTAAKAMLAIVAIVFVAEYAIMYGLVLSGLASYPPSVNFLDAVLLSVLTAPPIYWLVLNPVRREYEKRLLAEGEAQEMSRLAITDALTQIMNRRGITVGLLDAMAQAERYHAPLTIAMVDIDRFKQVNDTHGHKAGDKVLKDAAAVLSEALRMPDKVGRYGGEEFLIMLPHTTLAQGYKIADRIRATVSKWEFYIGTKKIKLTVSIGVAQYKTGEDLERFLSQADKALYEAKAGGRNQVVARKSS